MRLRTIAFCCLFITLLTACKMQTKDQATLAWNKQRIVTLYQYLATIRQTPLEKQTLAVFYTKNAVLTLNGRLFAKGLYSFKAHFEKILGEFHDYRFKFPHNPMVAEGNRVVIRYDFLIYHHDKLKYILPTVAIFTFQGGKISRWDDIVAFPKDFGYKT